MTFGIRILFACLLVLLYTPITAHGEVGSLMASPSREQNSTVLIVGASSARGWKDADNNGYLDRAFADLATPHGTDYHVINEAIPGAKIAQVKRQYREWIQRYYPDVVVISWGMLNDLHAHTPLKQFLADVQTEIEIARANDAAVIVVTPPVSEASYADYASSQSQFSDAVVQLVTKMHTHQVVAIDLFSNMKAYLQTHNIDIRLLSADGWHLNTAGHTLAGHILFDDLVRVADRLQERQAPGQL